jgi:hypothetical protein
LQVAGYVNAGNHGNEEGEYLFCSQPEYIGKVLLVVGRIKKPTNYSNDFSNHRRIILARPDSVSISPQLKNASQKAISPQGCKDASILKWFRFIKNYNFTGC